MLFENVRKEHVTRAIKDFENKGYPNGFGPSSTYDLVYESKRYPPKAIMAYANFHATGEEPTNNFSGGPSHDCFKALKREGFEIILKEKSMELINVKNEFANWILQHAPSSYRSYLGGYPGTVVNRLNEINQFFDRDLFEVGKDSYEQLIQFIRFKCSKKERLKTPEFYDYDRKHSRGIPIAILGKENYTKFLREKFSKQRLEPNYWVFQGNPKVFDFAKAIGEDKLNNFTVSAHKDKIKEGDKVIIWLSGDNAGCYALAEVTGAPRVVKSSPNNEHWKVENKNETYAQIKLTHNLFNSPITKEQIEHYPELQNLKVGFQGSNFSATQVEYETLLKMATEKKFTWIKTHEEIVEYLSNNKENQGHLIQLLKNAGCTIFNDQNPENVTIELDEIDPFTFFCYINKYFKQRVEILQNVARQINAHIPEDDYGIPSANPQKVWMFPWKYLRQNDEINKLWDLFYEVKNNSVSEESFQEVLKIRNVGKTKLTEALFCVNPENYFPINGPTKLWLKVLGVNSNFNSFSEYVGVLDAIKEKTSKPFYQLSYEAWLGVSDKEKTESDFTSYLKDFSKDDLDTYFSFLFEALDKLGIEEGDERLLYSTTNNNLAFTIGQRYSWVLSKNSRRSKFGVLSIDKIRPESKEFSGNLPFPFFTTMNEVNFSHKEKESIFNGFQQELERTTRSGFRKHSKEEFEQAVFDPEFRKKYQKANAMNTPRPKKPKNVILYGPPGTGKTFHLKNQLFEKYTSRQSSMTREEYLKSIVADCSWWQVIAVALLDLKKAKVIDIYDHEWVKIKERLSNSKTVRPTLWGQLQSHTVNDCEYVNVANRQSPQIFTKTEDSYWEILEGQVDELAPELKELKASVDNYQSDTDKVIKRYEFVTFHQSFSYEDFIEGIKPILPKEGEEIKDLGYTIEPGVFQRLCKRAAIDQENRYAIFIDEINRGNVSAIFGELITLIEIDKRKGAENELSITLPYSKERFSVPMNLDIYGTMNTADRSVEALDTALRRRFEFKEMMPKMKLIEDNIIEGVNLSEVLKTINRRIELLIDRDHTIGHSYFINVDSKIKLANAFKNKIVPLLQEYFYGDYGKIGLVLGSGFVEKLKNDNIEFADFEYENADDFKTPTFKLRKIGRDNILDSVRLLMRNDNKNRVE